MTVLDVKGFEQYLATAPRYPSTDEMVAYIFQQNEALTKLRAENARLKADYKADHGYDWSMLAETRGALAECMQENTDLRLAINLYQHGEGME